MIQKNHEPDPMQRAQQVKQTAESVSATIEAIQGLSPEDQREAVESLALEALGKDEEGKANLLAIQQARDMERTDEAEQLIKRQRGVLRRIQKDVAFMCGVHLDDTEDEKGEYRQRLHQKLDSLDANMTGEEANDEQIMIHLGFIRIDPETQERHFQFPTDLFPPYIRDQWDQYTRYVESHMTASKQHELGLGAEDDVVRWDVVRRLTHNGLAEDVRDFLEIEGWDKERCRKFITKMLEERNPTLETRETKLTSDAILRNYVELRTIDSYRPHSGTNNVHDNSSRAQAS